MITLRSLNQPLLNLYYLTLGRRSAYRGASSTIVMASPSTTSSDPPLVTIGDLGEDSVEDLIVAANGSDPQQPRDQLQIYRVAPNDDPQPMTAIRAFPQSPSAGISQLLVGDVDPDSPGAEVIVADDGAGGRASARVRILDGATLDTQRPLGQFRTLRSRRARDGGFTLALGNVLAADEGQQIIVGDAAGRVSVYSVGHWRAVRESRVSVFPESQYATAQRLTVGNVLTNHPGDEIIVGDNGARGDGLVRVLDGADGSVILEFTTFSGSSSTNGVQLWAGDVISNLPGAELIVGQGAGGGTLQVYSFTTGAPVHLFDISDPLPRRSSYKQNLAIGDLLPALPGDEVAIAQPDPSLPVQVFHLTESEAVLTNEIDPSDDGASAIGSLTIGR